MVSDNLITLPGGRTGAGTALEAQGFRILPHNLEAEQALLGALLVDNRALENVGDIIKAEHFFAPVHQRIFDAVRKMADRGQNADPITLKPYFENDAELEERGGAQYLADLAASVVTVINAANYARFIHDLYLRRNLIAVGNDLVNEAYEADIDTSATDCLESAESRLFEMAESGQADRGFVTMHAATAAAIELAEKAFKSDGHVTGVTTGLRDLDKKLGGLQPSDLIIVAGRPSMGKTAFATTMAFNAARAYAESGGQEGAIVGFFSLEMSADQLATRLLSDLAEISGDRIRRGEFSKEDFHRLAEQSTRLAQIPIYIDDTAALSITAVRTRARRMKRKHNLGMLVVDYLQLLRGTGSKQSENRVLEVSEITRGLKAIAKELAIPVVALSQLSRAVENREDKRPQLSDLRESGSIEQDADVVMFVYREQYYVEREKPNEADATKMAEWQNRMTAVHNVAEAVIGKQRHGPIGIVEMYFDAQYTRFKDLDRVHYDHG
ncbi:MAG: replicative DNA helicase [Rhodospirillales bacterium]|nr:replicative DNA helicase [Alphaproteobacteria bacterium]MCB9986925.1 replicative DNA helicase [Rhodospirillales bacterium]USO08300.1 MAG: replicative DNA helicase [Rhodospirillales bacterium]